ncbi:TPA: hypothetical protein QBF58_004993 [Escherichia coli O11:H5]|uniref:hypothetical protein n=1 Tax=Escherichia coli TaxID=562 RepID=UPI00164FCD83|nr:hypothetical protein [Escherichia coli]HDQ6732282.1 hypothetical protein [Escherichia coli O11:H5]EEW0912084.1 hypothetical protein [Escherichia coli]EFI6793560.1 hypothetical protein [Escherichia coli]EFJ0227257.1 hypothetical protein [Escherichia coli]MDM4038530.1 hypothetical protein [Escherichia coli]
MSRSAKPRKRKPAPQRSKLPRYVVKLHEDDFFDEEDAEVLHFDNFDDAVEYRADLNIPFFVDAGNKKLVFWFVRIDDEGRASGNRPLYGAGICDHSCRYQRRRHVLPGVWHRSLAGWCNPALLMLSPFCRHFSAGKPLA